MIIIAYNYEGKIISIVSAKSEELANAYWQGLGLPVHSHKNLDKDFMPLDEHPTGVFPILKTEETDGYSLSHSSKEKKYIIVK